MVFPASGAIMIESFEHVDKGDNSIILSLTGDWHSGRLAALSPSIMLCNSLLTEGKIRYISVLWMWGVTKTMIQLLNTTVRNDNPEAFRPLPALDSLCQYACIVWTCVYKSWSSHYHIFGGIIVNWTVGALQLGFRSTWWGFSVGYFLFTVQSWTHVLTRNISLLFGLFSHWTSYSQWKFNLGPVPNDISNT